MLPPGKGQQLAMWMHLIPLLTVAVICLPTWGRRLPVSVPAWGGEAFPVSGRHVRGSPAVRELVKVPGTDAQLTFRGPRDWTTCAVTQLETSHTCTVRRTADSDSASHACTEAAGAYIRQHANLCTLSIESVQEGHNGTWVASFDGDDQANVFDILNTQQVIALTVIAEPTAIEWRPQPISGQFNYIAGEPWSVAVVVHNVRPRPRIYWTMNNQSIEGVTVTTTTVSEQGVFLTVTETISLTGKEAYNGERLEYRYRLIIC